MAPRSAKMAPRSAKMAPRSAKMASRSAKMAPRSAKMAFPEAPREVRTTYFLIFRKLTIFYVFVKKK